MRAIVRLLLRTTLFGAVAVAAAFVAGWADDADAQTLEPELGDGPAPLSVTAPEPPSVPSTPALPSAPEVPQPPPVTAPPTPTLPSVPDLPPAPASPALPRLSPDVPGVAVPAPPSPPHGAGVDPAAITGIVGPFPAVPTFTPPEPPGLPPLATLPDPALPDPALPAPVLPDLPLPGPAPPAPGPIEIGLVSHAPTVGPDPSGAPPTARAPDLPGPSGPGPADDGGSFVVFDSSSGPARAPPAGLPMDACPGGGASHFGRADAAGLASPDADETTRRAGMLLDKHSYATARILDPVLRPD